MDVELDASDIRDLLNDIKNFYSEAELFGIPIEYRHEETEQYKSKASEIVSSLKLLSADYSTQHNIDIICTFSSNPIRIANSFIDYLTNVESDVNTVQLRMKNEKDQQIAQGLWSDNIDPRFANITDDFNRLKKEALG